MPLWISHQTLQIWTKSTEPLGYNDFPFDRLMTPTLEATGSNSAGHTKKHRKHEVFGAFLLDDNLIIGYDVKQEVKNLNFCLIGILTVLMVANQIIGTRKECKALKQLLNGPKTNRWFRCIDRSGERRYTPRRNSKRMILRRDTLRNCSRVPLIVSILQLFLECFVCNLFILSKA